MAISQKKRAMLAKRPRKGPISGIEEINLVTGGIAHKHRRPPLNARTPKKRRDDR